MAASFGFVGDNLTLINKKGQPMDLNPALPRLWRFNYWA